MRNLFVSVTILFTCVLCLSSCASQWQHRNTGEIRDSMPTYQDCKKEVQETALDHWCLNSCMTSCRNKYGQKANCMGRCQDSCTKSTGQMVLVDDYNCNRDRAEAEGWFRK